eukprot:gene5385-9192_t
MEKDLSLHEILENEELKSAFRCFCMKELSVENFIFLEKCNEYKATSKENSRREKADKIIEEFMTEDSLFELNINQAQIQEVKSIMEEGSPVDLFDKIQKTIEFLMNDTVMRFCNKRNNEVVEKVKENSRQEERRGSVVEAIGDFFGKKKKDKLMIEHNNKRRPSVQLLAKIQISRKTSAGRTASPLASPGSEGRFSPPSSEGSLSPKSPKEESLTPKGSPTPTPSFLKPSKPKRGLNSSNFVTSKLTTFEMKEDKEEEKLTIDQNSKKSSFSNLKTASFTSNISSPRNFSEIVNEDELHELEKITEFVGLKNKRRGGKADFFEDMMGGNSKTNSKQPDIFLLDDAEDATSEDNKDPNTTPRCILSEEKTSETSEGDESTDSLYISMSDLMDKRSSSLPSSTMGSLAGSKEESRKFEKQVESKLEEPQLDEVEVEPVLSPKLEEVEETKVENSNKKYFNFKKEQRNGSLVDTPSKFEINKKRPSFSALFKNRKSQPNSPTTKSTNEKSIKKTSSDKSINFDDSGSTGEKKKSKGEMKLENTRSASNVMKFFRSSPNTSRKSSKQEEVPKSILNLLTARGKKKEEEVEEDEPMDFMSMLSAKPEKEKESKSLIGLLTARGKKKKVEEEDEEDEEMDFLSMVSSSLEKKKTHENIPSSGLLSSRGKRKVEENFSSGLLSARLKAKTAVSIEVNPGENPFQKLAEQKMKEKDENPFHKLAEQKMKEKTEVNPFHVLAEQKMKEKEENPFHKLAEQKMKEKQEKEQPKVDKNVPYVEKKPTSNLNLIFEKAKKSKEKTKSRFNELPKLEEEEVPLSKPASELSKSLHDLPQVKNKPPRKQSRREKPVFNQFEPKFSLDLSPTKEEEQETVDSVSKNTQRAPRKQSRREKPVFNQFESGFSLSTTEETETTQDVEILKKNLKGSVDEIDSKEEIPKVNPKQESKSSRRKSTKREKPVFNQFDTNFSLDFSSSDAKEEETEIVPKKSQRAPKTSRREKPVFNQFETDFSFSTEETEKPIEPIDPKIQEEQELSEILMDLGVDDCVDVKN